MKTAAVYLRYSSSQQRETSLDDQLRICRNWIAAHGHRLPDENIFQDAATSGTTIAGRAGLDALLRRLTEPRLPFEVLVVDDLSRLSRDMGESFDLLKRFTFLDVQLIGVSDGFNSQDDNAKMNYGVRSLMNDMYIDSLRQKTMRGMEGQALRGRSTGGRLFGYKQEAVTPNVPDDGKRRVIYEAEAAVVRKVFALAAEGLTVGAILDVLVEQQALSPNPGKRQNRRKGWAYSSVRALLRNRHYCGLVEWKKTKSRKNPTTGKKTYLKRPDKDVIATEDATLAIVSKELFEKVQVLLEDRGQQFTRTAKGTVAGRKPGTTYSSALFSGILKCGLCGGAMVLVGGGKNELTGETYRQYTCAFSRKRGHTTCSNPVSISRMKIEKALVEHLNETLLTPEAIRFFACEFVQAWKAEAAASRDETALESLRKQVGEQQAKVTRLVDFLEQDDVPEVRQRLKEGSARLQQLKQELARLEDSKTGLVIPSSKAVENDLRRFSALLNGGNPVEAKKKLKELLGELKLTQVRMDAEGEAAEKTDGAQKQQSRHTWAVQVTGSAHIRNLLVPQDLPEEPAGLRPAVIAGAGFEPATFGL